MKERERKRERFIYICKKLSDLESDTPGVIYANICLRVRFPRALSGCCSFINNIFVAMSEKVKGLNLWG